MNHQFPWMNRHGRRQNHYIFYRTGKNLLCDEYNVVDVESTMENLHGMHIYYLLRRIVLSHVYMEQNGRISVDNGGSLLIVSHQSIIYVAKTRDTTFFPWSFRHSINIIHLVFSSSFSLASTILPIPNQQLFLFASHYGYKSIKLLCIYLTSS